MKSLLIFSRQQIYILWKAHQNKMIERGNRVAKKETNNSNNTSDKPLVAFNETKTLILVCIIHPRLLTFVVCLLSACQRTLINFSSSKIHLLTIFPYAYFSTFIANELSGHSTLYI